MSMNKDNWDVVIIGAGPAALTAAIYTGRAGLKTLILERQVIGGQVANIHEVENYPGFADGVSGMKLAENLRRQAERFGAKIEFAEVTNLTTDEEGVTIDSDSGQFRAQAVLIATGSGYRHLNVPGEKELRNKRVHYCATCDGALYKNKEIITVGGANSAIQNTVYLAGLAKHITMLVRNTLKADQVLQDRLQKLVDDGKVDVVKGWHVTRVKPNDEGIIATATDGKEEKDFAADGMFVFIGVGPNTGFLENTAVERDDRHCVITDDNGRTNVERIWACGDVRSGAKRQIITAAGDGAAAASDIVKFVRGIKRG